MSSSITTKAFWKDAGERAVSTAAQSAIAVIGIGALGILTVDWEGVGSAAALAGVLSVLKALAASGTGDGTASFVDTTPALVDVDAPQHLAS